MHATTAIIALLSLAGSGLAAPAAGSSNTPAATMQKRFVGGWCGVHVKTVTDQYGKQTAHVKVYDAAEFLVGSGDVEGDHGSIGGLPDSFEVNIGGGHTAAFEYGDQHWDTGSSQCSVGKADLTNVFTGRQTQDLDCGFSC